LNEKNLLLGKIIIHFHASSDNENIDRNLLPANIMPNVAVV